MAGPMPRAASRARTRSSSPARSRWTGWARSPVGSGTRWAGHCSTARRVWRSATSRCRRSRTRRHRRSRPRTRRSRAAARRWSAGHVGAGMEFALTNYVSAKAEYMYYSTSARRRSTVDNNLRVDGDQGARQPCSHRHQPPLQPGAAGGPEVVRHAAAPRSPRDVQSSEQQAPGAHAFGALQRSAWALRADRVLGGPMRLTCGRPRRGHRRRWDGGRSCLPSARTARPSARDRRR